MRNLAVHAATAASLLAGLCLPAPPASAGDAPQPRRFVASDGRASFIGNSSHLPVGAGANATDAIRHARMMPAVLAALERCAARGYLRHAERDTAFASSDPPVTAVVLALEKPGIVNPEGLLGAPIVQIGTALDEAGNPSTQVSGGLVFCEIATGAMRAAEDVPGFAAEGTFDVPPPTGGGGEPVYRTERVVACFHDYLFCAGFGNGTCVVSALLPPGGWWSVARAAVCIAANTTRCVYGFAKCWDPQ
jgi:hypothetical protein